ncbi:MAG: ATP-dependent metallopeptidase FtsH/Yme1/Tma family protein, partial [Christensenellaceae bacterium]
MKNNRMIRSVVLLVLLVAVVIGMAYLFNGSLAPKATEYQYTEFIKQVKDGKVDAVYAVQTQLVGRYKDSSIPESAFPDRYDFSASIPSTDQLMEDLKRVAAESRNVSADDITSADLTVDVKIGQPARESLFTQLLPLLISVALMAGLWWLF